MTAVHVRDTLADLALSPPTQPPSDAPSYASSPRTASTMWPLSPASRRSTPTTSTSSWTLGGLHFGIPFIASAMDGVVDVDFAIALGKLGGLAIIDLEGLQTRYEQPAEPLAEIAAAPARNGDRASCSSCTRHRSRTTWWPTGSRRSRRPACPRRCGRHGPGRSSRADRGRRRGRPVRRRPVDGDLAALPLAHGRTAARFRALLPHARGPGRGRQLCRLQRGVRADGARGSPGLLVGVGPGAASQQRGRVLGIGVPQVTATLDCAAARDAYFDQQEYVPDPSPTAACAPAATCARRSPAARTRS